MFNKIQLNFILFKLIFKIVIPILPVTWKTGILCGPGIRDAKFTMEPDALPALKARCYGKASCLVI